MNKFGQLEQWFRGKLTTQAMTLEDGRLLPSAQADRVSRILTEMVASCDQQVQEGFYAVLNRSEVGSFVVNTASRATGILYYATAREWLDELETALNVPTSSIDRMLEEFGQRSQDDTVVMPAGFASDMRFLADMLDRAGVSVAARPADLTEPLNLIRNGASAIRDLVRRGGFIEEVTNDG